MHMNLNNATTPPNADLEQQPMGKSKKQRKTIPDGYTWLNVPIPAELHSRLKYLADSSSLSLKAYLEKLLGPCNVVFHGNQLTFLCDFAEFLNSPLPVKEEPSIYLFNQTRKGDELNDRNHH